MRPRLILALALIPALAACSQFPQLDDTLDSAARDAPYPDLIPIEGIQAQIPGTMIDPDSTARIAARVTRLKARAARLRGTVIDSTSRARMRQGVSRNHG